MNRFACLCGVFLWAVAAASAATSRYEGRRIDRILVVRHDIYDETVPSENKLLYRGINALHISTKERTILQQLLFKKGDAYRRDLADESERALRLILRLRDVRIRAVPRGEDRVDVLVHTRETWSTEPFIGVSGSGSDTKYILGLRERNLLGRGKFVEFLYKDEPKTVTRTFSYVDPALGGSRLRLSGRYSDAAEGSSRSLNVERPFYSSISRFSHSTFGGYENGESVVFNQGEETGRFRRENRSLGGGVGVSVGSTFHRIRRLGLDYKFSHERLSKKGEGLLEDRVYHVFGVRTEWQNVRYVTETHVRLFSREEDFNLGPAIALGAGLSQSRWVTGSRNAGFVNGIWTQGHLPAPGRLWLLTLQTQGRREKTWENLRSRLKTEYYHRARPWSTWAVHGTWEQIQNPDRDEQLMLGATSGLRGYPVNQFTGNRLVIANLENRLYFLEDLFKLFDLGAVGFIDAGGVWPRGEGGDVGDVRADAGVGLRIHLTRSSLGQVLRFDIAWPSRSTEGKKDPVFSFGTGQVF